MPAQNNSTLGVSIAVNDRVDCDVPVSIVIGWEVVRIPGVQVPLAVTLPVVILPGFLGAMDLSLMSTKSAKADSFGSPKGFFEMRKGFSPPKMAGRKFFQKSTDNSALYPLLVWLLVMVCVLTLFAGGGIIVGGASLLGFAGM